MTMYKVRVLSGGPLWVEADNVWLSDGVFLFPHKKGNPRLAAAIPVARVISIIAEPDQTQDA